MLGTGKYKVGYLTQVELIQNWKNSGKTALAYTARKEHSHGYVGVFLKESEHSLKLIPPLCTTVLS